MNREQYFKNFFDHIENGIQKRGVITSIASEVDRLERAGGIPAQKLPGKGKFEEIFTSTFLMEEIAGFHFSPAFRQAFKLNEAEIRSGLAYEGWKQPGMDNFNSSPVVSVGFKTILSKGAAGWKGSWCRKDSSGGLPALAPCPDIALKSPLPFTAVGDVKYFRGHKTKDQILNELHQAVGEIFFYYAAMNMGRDLPVYENGILVIADATADQAVMKSIRGAVPGLEDRLFNTPGFFVKILQVG